MSNKTKKKISALVVVVVVVARCPPPIVIVVVVVAKSLFHHTKLPPRGAVVARDYWTVGIRNGALVSLLFLFFFSSAPPTVVTPHLSYTNLLITHKPITMHTLALSKEEGEGGARPPRPQLLPATHPLVLKPLNLDSSHSVLWAGLCASRRLC